MLCRAGLILLFLTSSLLADLKWTSPTTGGEIAGRVIEPAKSDKPLPTVVYLTNLSIRRMGREPLVFYDQVIGKLDPEGSCHKEARAGRRQSTPSRLC
jgi:hypothetical protein